ncbi:MAG TPA: porin family protein [Bacteroidales bacterium]|jgi:hypothetical protein|nr:outer membrane beta-barrel protein [Bacteroidales bacterium]MZQ50296.1 outer membrane beta-barrel protein [Bacteroidales bacterium]HNY51890.1 porin family protein [Bacteroidales bacterium]HOG55915.1 porin family protein [Bacteroidales bacterium]HQB85638.1 porin family protein [Bacteroidales bacterium]
MKTKLFAGFIFMVLFSLSIQAQEGTRFGVLGGVNFQNINGKDNDGDKFENDLKPGFHAGVNAILGIAPEFYLQPGILFSTKGCKLEDSDLKLNVSYLEIPLNFLYRGELGNGYVLVGFGPYLGFGLSGKLKTDDGHSIDVEFSNEYVTGSIVTMKRFDAGANVFAGYELSSGIFFQLNTQLGLLKINPEATGKLTWKNTGFGLSAGYRF